MSKLKAIRRKISMKVIPRKKMKPVRRRFLVRKVASRLGKVKPRERRIIARAKAKELLKKLPKIKSRLILPKLGKGVSPLPYRYAKKRVKGNIKTLMKARKILKARRKKKKY